MKTPKANPMNSRVQQEVTELTETKMESSVSSVGSCLGPARYSHSGGSRPGRAWSALGAVIAFMGVLSARAFAGNPAEEMAKAGTTTTTGGLDPHGDSWLSIQNSLHQFGHQGFLVRIFLSLSLAVGCAWVIACLLYTSPSPRD